MRVAMVAFSALIGLAVAQEPEQADDLNLRSWPQSPEATELMIREILAEHGTDIERIDSIECTPTNCEVRLPENDGASVMRLYSEVLFAEFLSIGASAGFVRRDLLSSGSFEYVIGMMAPSRPARVAEHEIESEPSLAAHSTSSSVARQPEEPDPSKTSAEENLTADEAAWFKAGFDERQRRFQLEGRDLDWAESMERAIAEEIGSWDNPPVQLLSAECRVTMCRIATYWPPNPYLDQLGQQHSYISGLGLDPQGEGYGVDEGNGYLDVVIARRR